MYNCITLYNRIADKGWECNNERISWMYIYIYYRDIYGLENHGIPWLYYVATENSVPWYPKIHYSQWYCEFIVIHVPHENLHWCNKMSNTPMWSLMENTHAVIHVFQFLLGIHFFIHWTWFRRAEKPLPKSWLSARRRGLGKRQADGWNMVKL